MFFIVLAVSFLGSVHLVRLYFILLHALLYVSTWSNVLSCLLAYLAFSLFQLSVQYSLIHSHCLENKFLCILLPHLFFLLSLVFLFSFIIDVTYCLQFGKLVYNPHFHLIFYIIEYLCLYIHLFI